METEVNFRGTNEEDRNWITNLLTEEWGSTVLVSRGKLYNGLNLPAIVAEIHNRPAGLLTYNIEDSKCEIVTLNSLTEGRGVGTGLINEIKRIAKENGSRSVWLTTTNDNKRALKFYQNRGFKIVAFLKKKENEDYYDRHTDFNPFSLET
jgi:N-acetylglutamate synthase-like GNAT family acetyltransferase